MVGQMVTFPVNGGSASGYLSIPAAGKGPGIVVLQEWWGLVAPIKSVADRFSAARYLALAPDLYEGKVALEEAEAQHHLKNLDWGKATAQITAAVRYLRGQGSAKVGVVGFCMGGALSMIAAAK